MPIQYFNQVSSTSRTQEMRKGVTSVTCLGPTPRILAPATEIMPCSSGQPARSSGAAVLPLFYSMADIARAIGKTTSATRQWFRYHGMSRKVGGRWLITSDQLGKHYPHILQRLLEAKASKSAEE